MITAYEGRLEAQAEADDHPAVVVDQERQPGLPDGPRLRAHHHFQRAVVYLHPIEHVAGKLARAMKGMTGIGDLPSPPLPIHLPGIHLGNTPRYGPCQRGLSRHGDRLCRREPGVGALQIVDHAARHCGNRPPRLVEIYDVDRLFQEAAQVRMSLPQSMSP